MTPGPTGGLRIERLDADSASDADVSALDRLLQADAAAFVRAHQHLESAAERLGEAAADPERIVLVARAGGRLVGLLDARIHHPEPMALTVAVIAVDRAARGQGAGRALVAAAVETSRGLMEGAAPRLVTGVHVENLSARAFFHRLGLAEADESGGVMVMTTPIASSNR